MDIVGWVQKTYSKLKMAWNEREERRLLNNATKNLNSQEKEKVLKAAKDSNKAEIVKLLAKNQDKKNGWLGRILKLVTVILVIWIGLLYLDSINYSPQNQYSNPNPIQASAPPVPPTHTPIESTGKNSLTDLEILYYQNQICPKIQYTDPAIRDAAVQIAKNTAGSWNVEQLVELYAWSKTNISYVSDPANKEYFASATETLNIRAGDCDDQAILIASLIQSIGGTAKVVVAPNCQHALAAVFVSKNQEDFDQILQSIATIYYEKGIYDLSQQTFHHYKDGSGLWLIVDPAGGSYLGDTFPECTGFYSLSC